MPVYLRIDSIHLSVPSRHITTRMRGERSEVPLDAFIMVILIISSA